MLDKNKELTPVIYNETSVKYLYNDISDSGKLCFPIHWHERIEILLITEGSLKLHLEGKSVLVTSGQAVIIGPRMIHSGSSGPEGVSYHVLMFEPTHFLNQSKASEQYIAPICNFETTFQIITDYEPIVSAITRLAELGANNNLNALFSVSSVYYILGLLYQHYYHEFATMSKGDSTFRSVLEYLNDHYSEKISAKDMSKKFGYNESYFCRRFKDVTGYTVMNYIFLLRMETAHKLLKTSADEIGIIAKKCGFADISYFSNCFKKYFGCAPTEFRARTNEIPNAGP